MRLLAPAAIAAVLLAPAAAQGAPPLGAPEVVRVARATDAQPRPGSLTEWWELAAVHPRTREAMRVRFTRSTRVPTLQVAFTSLDWRDQLWQELVPRGAGVVSSAGPEGTAKLHREGRHWRLTMTGPRVKGRLTLRRPRPGATGLRWRLGEELRSPPRWERVGLSWSTLVATSRVTGTLTVEGRRVRFRGWRGSLEHVWGAFQMIGDAWDLANAFIVHRRGGGAAVVFGLNGQTATGPGAIDAQWLGVLAVAGRRGTAVCRPVVHRRDWSLGGGLGGHPSYARTLRARCGRTRITFRELGRPGLWGGDWLGFYHYASLATATGGGLGIASPFGRR
jgi:hypothetical protein